MPTVASLSTPRATQQVQHLYSALFWRSGRHFCINPLQPSLAAIGHWFNETARFRNRHCMHGWWTWTDSLAPCNATSCTSDRIPWVIRIIALICASVISVLCPALRKRLPNNKESGAAIDISSFRDSKFASTTVAIFLIEFDVFIPYTYISTYALYVGVETSRCLAPQCISQQSVDFAG